MRTAIVIVLVVALVAGGLLALRRTRNAGMPDKDVLERAKARERTISEDESGR
jgi:hypothetical protein